MYIYPNSNYNALTALEHPVFIAVEKEFWNWLESTNPAMEYEAMYFSDDAIYNKKAAIKGAIEEMMNEANETGKPVLITTFDLDAVFS